MTAEPQPTPAAASPQIRPVEAHAFDAAASIPADRIVATTLGRAQGAAELAAAHPAASVCCWFLDEYQQQRAASHDEQQPANLALVCQADLPAGPFQLAVLPISKQGEAELTRDILQSACQQLALGGTLVAAVDNPHDRWLREQLAELFAKVTVRSLPDATVYIARKTAEPRKLRDFRCEFVFRDFDRLVRAVSRPGVFSHRHIDPGARQLLAAAVVKPGMRVLDIGCGAGTVSLALALREPRCEVFAIDSNARAVECTQAGAALNELTNVTAALDARGESLPADSFDLAVANPPYYADQRIAEHFLTVAHRALRPGGQVLVVAKRPDWYVLTMPQQWDDVDHWPAKRYHLVSAIKKETDSHTN
jgi:16S rRNA G1207 methylase RsmC